MEGTQHGPQEHDACSRFHALCRRQPRSRWPVGSAGRRAANRPGSTAPARRGRARRHTCATLALPKTNAAGARAGSGHAARSTRARPTTRSTQPRLSPPHPPPSTTARIAGASCARQPAPPDAARSQQRPRICRHGRHHSTRRIPLLCVDDAEVSEHEADLVGKVHARRVLGQQAHKHAKHDPAAVADLVRRRPAKQPAGARARAAAASGRAARVSEAAGAHGCWARVRASRLHAGGCRWFREAGAAAASPAPAPLTSPSAPASRPPRPGSTCASPWHAGAATQW